MDGCIERLYLRARWHFFLVVSFVSGYPLLFERAVAVLKFLNLLGGL